MEIPEPKRHAFICLFKSLYFILSENSGKIKIFAPSTANQQHLFSTTIRPATSTNSQIKQQQLPLFTPNRTPAPPKSSFNFGPTAATNPSTNNFQNQQKYASPSQQPLRNAPRSSAVDGNVASSVKNQRKFENPTPRLQTQSPATYVKPFSVTWSNTQPKNAPLVIYHNPTTATATPPTPAATYSSTEHYSSQRTDSGITTAQYFTPKQPLTGSIPNNQFSYPSPRGFSLPNQQLFVTPVTPTRKSSLQTFVTTISPIQDISVSSPNDPDLTLQRLRSLKGVDDDPSFVDDNNLRRSGATTETKSSSPETRRIGGPSVKLEWTLPDIRAMLFIPDDPADAVAPNIKRYSVTIPQPKMVFKSSEGVTAGPCPSHCDPKFVDPATCHPCVMIK